MSSCRRSPVHFTSGSGVSKGEYFSFIIKGSQPLWADMSQQCTRPRTCTELHPGSAWSVYRLPCLHRDLKMVIYISYCSPFSQIISAYYFLHPRLSTFDWLIAIRAAETLLLQVACPITESSSTHNVSAPRTSPYILYEGPASGSSRTYRGGRHSVPPHIASDIQYGGMVVAKSTNPTEIDQSTLLKRPLDRQIHLRILSRSHVQSIRTRH